MVQKPVIVGAVYFLDGVARMKMSMSYLGEPVTGQIPTVTIIRDTDNYALNFNLDQFEAFGVPADLDQAKYKTQMTELGLGSYWWDYDPSLYSETTEQLYTVIFRNETPGLQATTNNEFTMTNRFHNVRFGLLDRPKQVCLNEQVLIAYQALPNQNDVLITIYNPSDQILVANATMTELESTGIYRYEHIFTLDGEYIITCSEATNGSKDSMIIVAGRACDRLKRMEKWLGDLMQNPPTVNPC